MKIKVMLYVIIIYIIMFSTVCIGQTSGLNSPFRFKDNSKTSLEFIGNEFYKNVQGLDSCCITAFGSAKFIITNVGKIDSVWISVGVPKPIATFLEEAIYSTATYWEINKNYKSISVIIPLFIAPSNRCTEDKKKDDILVSAANMYIYRNGHAQVRRSDYLKKASGLEEGVILSPLLIKDKLNDVFSDGFRSK